MRSTKSTHTHLRHSFFATAARSRSMFSSQLRPIAEQSERRQKTSHFVSVVSYFARLQQSSRPKLDCVMGRLDQARCRRPIVPFHLLILFYIQDSYKTLKRESYKQTASASAAKKRPIIHSLPAAFFNFISFSSLVGLCCSERRLRQRAYIQN